jgi:RNA polymerase sigma-32 factor
MNMRLKAHDGSLNATVDSDADGTTEWQDFISDNKPNQEEKFAYKETLNYRRKLFNKAINVLNPREKDILYKRRMSDENITLDDLSRIYNISKERVRQIELNSIRKISKAIEVMQ